MRETAVFVYLSTAAEELTLFCLGQVSHQNLMILNYGDSSKGDQQITITKS